MLTTTGVIIIGISRMVRATSVKRRFCDKSSASASPITSSLVTDPTVNTVVAFSELPKRGSASISRTFSAPANTGAGSLVRVQRDIASRSELPSGNTPTPSSTISAGSIISSGTRLFGWMKNGDRRRAEGAGGGTAGGWDAALLLTPRGWRAR